MSPQLIIGGIAYDLAQAQRRLWRFMVSKKRIMLD
jgi:hypothetical protein